MKSVTTTGRWRVPWVQELPDNWEFVSSKRLFQTRPDLASVDEPQLAATQAYGVIEQAEYERRVGRKVTKLNKNLDKRRLVKRNDFIISMRSFEGGLERAWAEGGIRSSYIVLKPATDIVVGYYQHLFKSQPYIDALRATGNFIRDGQDLNYSNFSLVDLPYPPLEDQVLIARYLDWHGAMTGKLIRAKRRLIALLNEQKQSIIHRAVTCGLDRNASLKPSGVDWLGEVPAHWEVKRLKWIAHNTSEQANRCDDGDIYVALEDIESWSGRLLRVGPANVEGVILRRFECDDVLFGKLRPYLAKVIRPDRRGVCVGELLVLRADRAQVQPSFLEARLRARDFITHVNSSTFGAKMPRADWSLIGGTVIAFPPTLREQIEIVDAIAAETNYLDNAIQDVGAEIALIQQFRARLIADVVTGQLDVRAISASLPEVAEADAAADLTDADDLDEDADDLIDEEEAA